MRDVSTQFPANTKTPCARGIFNKRFEAIEVENDDIVDDDEIEYMYDHQTDPDYIPDDEDDQAEEDDR